VSRPGFVIKRTFERPDEEVVARLSRSPTGHIGDALGRSGAMCSRVRLIAGNMPMCGAALTVEAPPGDNLVVWKALSMAGPGDVIVVATGGHDRHAVWGDQTAAIASQKGLAGLVTDGAVRDVRGLREVGLPTFAAAVTPNSPEKDGPGRVNLPVSCGGRVVCPGDIVIGDADGVVVVPKDLAKAVLVDLDRIDGYEQERATAIVGGNGMPNWIDERLAELGCIEL
jgi:4-hydroxy-4-methyl-2-oxoglutarate aldolase